MKQYAQVLTFAEALKLTQRGQQIMQERLGNHIATTQMPPIKLYLHADGVWRELKIVTGSGAKEPQGIVFTVNFS